MQNCNQSCVHYYVCWLVQEVPQEKQAKLWSMCSQKMSYIKLASDEELLLREQAKEVSDNGSD